MTRITQLAELISIVGHPFVTITLLVATLAMRQRHGHGGAQPIFLVVVLVIVPVGMLMFWQVRRGRWSNADASNAPERPVLFLVALSGVLASIGWLLLKHPESFMIHGMFVVAAFLCLAALLTRWIKLSLHVAFAALAATVLCLIGSWVGYTLVAVVPSLFWSRLILSRHSIRELAVGLVLGVLAGFAMVQM